MTLNFQKLKIKNFMSIGEATLAFDKEGFILIDAENHRIEDNSNSNGSGKSSIFEALIWAITGETIRGHKTIYNKYVTDPKALCEVRVDFEFKEHSWQILRIKNATGSQQLAITKDGVLLPAKGLRDAEETLEKQLPELTMKFLGSTVILGQGLPQRFTNNSPAGRKAVLEELSNADFMIMHVKDNIQRRKTKLESELEITRERIAAAIAKIQVNTTNLERLQSQLTSLEEFDLVKAGEQLAQLEVEGKKLNEILAERVELYKRKEAAYLESKQEEYSIAAQIASYTSEIRQKCEEKKNSILKEIYIEIDANLQKCSEESEGISEELRKIRESLEHKKAIVSGGFCKTCGQRLQGISQEEIDAAKAEIPSLEEDVKCFEKKLSTMKMLISDLRTKRQTEQQRVEAEVNVEKDLEISAKKAEFDAKLNEIRKMEDELRLAYMSAKRDSEGTQEALSNKRTEYRVLKEKIQMHEKTVETVKSDIHRCKEDILKSESDRSSQEALRDNLQERIKVISSMMTFASRDFRGILLEGIISQLDSILHSYAEKVYGSPLTKFVQDGNAISISFDGKEYEALSGGEKQRLDVLIQLSLRDLIVQTSGIETNILAFDEIFDALDATGCEAVMDVLIELGKQTFVITHRSKELSIPFDSTITVVKESNGIAHLEMR